MNSFLPKDYVFVDGFYAAVVSPVIENGRVLTTVRYYQDEMGDVVKFNTKQANQFLQNERPDFLFHSNKFDVLLHGIPLDQIEKIFSPRDAYFNLKTLPIKDKKQIQAMEVLELLKDIKIDSQQIGITGSILIGFQSDSSDIDVVIYGRDNFKTAREYIKNIMGRGIISPLTEKDWLESYDRRACAIDFDTYLFHEQRKFNKFLYDQTKVDISLVNSNQEITDDGPYKKLGNTIIQAKVIDDTQSFDLPACYFLDDPQFPELVCYTATYTGQALQDERVEVAGKIEVNNQGSKRIVVGTSREAENEYIKVID